MGAVRSKAGITEYLADISDIDDAVKEHEGTPYVSDALRAIMLGERIRIIREAEESAEARLKIALKHCSESLDARRDSPSLSKLSQDAIRVSGNFFPGALQTRALGEYIRTLHHRLLSDSGFLRHNDLVIVDNSYGDDNRQYVADVKKGYGINYHPTLFSIEIGFGISDDDVSALAAALDTVISDDDSDDGVSMVSIRTIPVETPEKSFLFMDKVDADDKGWLAEGDDIASPSHIDVTAFHPALAGILRLGGLPVLSVDEVDDGEPVAKLLGRGENRLGDALPVYAVRTGATTVRFRVA